MKKCGGKKERSDSFRKKGDFLNEHHNFTLPACMIIIVISVLRTLSWLYLNWMGREDGDSKKTACMQHNDSL